MSGMETTQRRSFKLFCKQGHYRTAETVLINGDSARCKTCRNKSKKLLRLNSPYSRAYFKYAAKNREKMRVRTQKSRLIKVYGISFEEYNKLFEIQRGCCKICGIHQSQMTRQLHVDHDHELKIIRGLLCMKCNTGLGMFKDSSEVIMNAAKYVENKGKI